MTAFERCVVLVAASGLALVLSAGMSQPAHATAGGAGAAEDGNRVIQVVFGSTHACFDVQIGRVHADPITGTVDYETTYVFVPSDPRVCLDGV